MSELVKLFQDIKDHRYGPRIVRELAVMLMPENRLSRTSEDALLLNALLLGYQVTPPKNWQTRAVSEGYWQLETSDPEAISHARVVGLTFNRCASHDPERAEFSRLTLELSNCNELTLNQDQVDLTLEAMRDHITTQKAPSGWKWLGRLYEPAFKSMARDSELKALIPHLMS